MAVDHAEFHVDDVRTGTDEVGVAATVGRAVRAASPVAEAGLVALVAFTQLGGIHGLVRLATSIAFGLMFSWIALAARRHYASTSAQRHGVAASVAGALGGGVPLSAVALWAPALGLGVGDVLRVTLGAACVLGMWRWVRAGCEETERIMLVGDDGLNELLDELARVGEGRFEISGVWSDDRYEGVRTPLEAGGTSLRRAVELVRPDLVVVLATRGRPEVFGELREAASAGFRVVGLAEFCEYAFGRLPVRQLTPAWFMSILHLYQRPYTQTAKRLFDVTVAGAAIVLVLPVIVIVAALVACSGRPVLFRQTRIGEHGRPFTILKFRTMRNDAEAGGAVWAKPRDPRTTAIGRVLRVARFDELPQLWNVLRGDMSIVGPRPERPEFAPQLEREVAYWTARHLVKPGITGWAQISCGYSDDELGTEEKLSYDLWYLRHRGLFVDVVICLKTLPRMLSGAGAR